MTSTTTAPEANGPIQLENTAKRDYLKSLEHKYQARWKEEHLFEVDAPTTSDASLRDMDLDELRKKYPKFFGTVPFAYMNGSLHLGHAFTMSKLEFATGYERMKGRRALFPWAFHCTGMPIKAAADKLVREIEMFGPDFENYVDEVAEEKLAPDTATSTTSTTHSNVDKAKKGKVAAKATGLKYQFQIMRSIAVPNEEIKKFADPHYWLKYFPPIAKADCDAFGARIDWRRAFITTDVNPYYDTFVRWQVNKLHAVDKIKFGERYTIYSPKDGQPCMDHDRQSGEALGPQEYTGVKMELVQWSAAAAPILDKSTQGKKVFFVAATLRPETMYGQTNCFVGPTIDYGVFTLDDDSVIVCTDRAARNMTFQGTFKERGKVDKIASIKGSDLVGTKIKAPFSVYNEVYMLPMEGVLATKGTGVVTSVPSDSPDDYATLMDLRKKAEYYKIDPSWAALDPTPVISTPMYGNLTAETLVKKLKIQSQKDKVALAEAKDLAYKEGFYSGTMLVGTYKGESVQDAKPKVREEMIKAGLAFPYAEPEGLIISRSGDECVVALQDQWYLDYGEDEWKAQAEKLLAQMNTYNQETRNGFEQVINWLRQWACARSFGLGSRLPWDPQFLVESLSDSTIYMSYYTVAYLLQGGVEDGSKPGPLGITPDQLTDEMWEYILGSGAFPTNSTIPREKADILKAEFNYFYPIDIRTSGKDLIPNHLTFCIYIHAAIFPEKLWPQSMRANGHLMLNGAKMSKSTGNSLTLREAVEKFGADATRLSLADAGDGIEDANFEEKTANANILRLHTLIEWTLEQVSNKDKLRTGPKSEYTFWDKVFENEMNELIAHTDEYYSKTLYKDALKSGFYELQMARDLYREATADIGMHVDLVFRWIRVQALLVLPLAPHYAEHIWTAVLGEKESVQLARFPELSAPVSKELSDAATYVRTLIKTIRDAELAVSKKKAKGKGPVVTYDPSKPKELRIFIATSFPEWQERCIVALRENINMATGQVDEAGLRQSLDKKGLFKDKKAMPFIKQLQRRMSTFGIEATLNRALPFKEAEVLDQILPYLARTLKFSKVNVESKEEAEKKAGEPDAAKAGYEPKMIETAEPGNPGFAWYNV